MGQTGRRGTPSLRFVSRVSKCDTCQPHLYQIDTILRSAFPDTASMKPASRQIGVTQQTYYRWRKEYGGLRIDQAKRFREMEKENARLKKLVADLALDNSILKEIYKGKF